MNLKLISEITDVVFINPATRLSRLLGEEEKYSLNLAQKSFTRVPFGLRIFWSQSLPLGMRLMIIVTNVKIVISLENGTRPREIFLL